EQIDHPEKLGTIRFSLPHPFDSTVHAKSAPTSRLPTIVSAAANRWWENHIAGAYPPKYNRLSTRIECRSGFFSDRRADARGLVSVWGAGAQSQPIVRLSAHVSYSYFHFTLADHVFEIACKENQRDRDKEPTLFQILFGISFVWVLFNTDSTLSLCRYNGRESGSKEVGNVEAQALAEPQGLFGDGIYHYHRRGSAFRRFAVPGHVRWGRPDPVGHGEKSSGNPPRPAARGRGSTRKQSGNQRLF